MEGRAAVLGAMWALDLLFTGVNTQRCLQLAVLQKRVWLRAG